jgi:hypothetical protein
VSTTFPFDASDSFALSNLQVEIDDWHRFLRYPGQAGSLSLMSVALRTAKT